MSCCPSVSDREIGRLAAGAGAVACGVAQAGEVSGAAASSLRNWVGAGCHASMRWLERHVPLRDTTDSVLPGARSVVVCAFNYKPPVSRDPSLPRFASYAYGEDYHEVVRRRLGAMSDEMKARWGGDCRVCVDTAPVSERYWAQRAGVGFQGRNGLLIVPGAGSYVVLGEVVTTLEVVPSQRSCGACPPGCRRCVDACPGGALLGDGRLDARRCLSYITIESRDALPDGVRLCGQVYGCDICQRVCPLNAGAECSALPEFRPSDEFLRLSLDDILLMSEPRFRAVFGHSAVRRAGLEGLRRNAIALRQELQRSK